MAEKPFNPIELCEAAHESTRALLAGVSPDQLKNPTPCDEWNVEQLVNHVVEFAAYVTSVLTAEPPDTVPGDDAADRFAKAVASLLVAAKSPGALEKKGEGATGQRGADALMLFVADLVVHNWDLATATGQRSTASSELLRAAHDHYENLPLDGTPGWFGARARVPAAASMETKLLAFTGRRC